MDSTLTERKTSMLAKITLAGENTYKIHFRGLLVQEVRLTTRLMPPWTVEENALMWRDETPCTSSVKSEFRVRSFDPFRKEEK